MQDQATSWLLGRLEPSSFSIWEAVQHPSLNHAIAAGAAAAAIIGAIAAALFIIWLRAWKPLWRDWLTSTDHKRIGIMYIVLALVMLTRGVIEGVIMRAQQAHGLGGGFVQPEHFAQLFSTHGTIMIFFMGMPFLTGIINYVMPLQIGARDVSFPMLNQISLGLTAAGAALIMISLVAGEFSTGGWTAYPPYTGMAFNPGTGPDYWIWSVAIAGLGSTLTGINFAVTIYKERAPGMHLFRMPLFTWTALCTAIIMVFAMPPLTVASLTLALDRYLDFHFFTNDLGGNMMNYANLFWLFGHPEVYILVLPAFGIYSEVISTFSGKRLYGYTSLVYATMAIAVLSFTVWLHHFFTMGQTANVNAAFGIATMLIGIPTGVKIYDWMATMFRGRVRMTVPMFYATGFLILFALGGLTGIILANPTVDYQVHNTVFLVAHFHNVLIPGLLFGMLAGYTYWFPKAFGFRLHEGWGRASALLWIFGFAITFFPLYMLGLMGMPRRMASYSNPAFEPYTLISVIGAALLFAALCALLIQLWVSIRWRAEMAAPVGDPWDGRTLEWFSPSPPPGYNFAVIPTVEALDAFAVEKAGGKAYPMPAAFEDIEMPRNTALGMILCIAATGLGLALVWYIWWLAILCAAAIVVAFIARTFILDTSRIIPAAQVAKEYHAWRAEIDRATVTPRDDEVTPTNRGRAWGATTQAGGAS
ncbi:cbb3-type cytochrome c oxidase subunit I [Roseovarius sp. S1116L3]|uniref:cbb3-type cytochrome c oxidase subunit I n=1 Tax=Roseovarius roseus TaxID=3342636 RepID=UPI00372CDD67